MMQIAPATQSDAAKNVHAMVCRQAVVSWTTANQTANPIVQYGTASGTYTNNATAAFDSYSRSDMCGSIANSTGWTDPGRGKAQH